VNGVCDGLEAAYEENRRRRAEVSEGLNVDVVSG
jgi:hypothetical protein